MSRAEDVAANLLVKAQPLTEGCNLIVRRGEMGLKHLKLSAYLLSCNHEFDDYTGDCERGIVIQSGQAYFQCEGRSFDPVGKKDGLFGDPPPVLYVPPGNLYYIGPEQGSIELLRFSALAEDFEGEAKVFRPGDIPKGSAGSGCTEREEWSILGRNGPSAKLILGEMLIPPGHWTEAHKHDAFNPPHEVPLEEICYFRVSPASGFGVVRIWTGPNDPGPMDEVYVIEDGDTVVIPRGYHIIAAAPGSSVRCTYALAGDFRIPGADARTATDGD